MIKQLIDYAVSGDMDRFVLYSGFLCIIIIVQLCIGGVYRHLEEYAKSSLENTFKEKLYQSILDREYALISGYHSGDLMNRMTSDVTIISNMLVSILPNLSLMITKLIGASVCLFILDWHFAAVFLVCGLFMVVIGSLMRSRMKILHADVQVKEGEVRSFLQETVGNLLIIRSFSTEDIEVEKARGLMAEHRKSRMRKAVLSNFSQSGFSTVMNAGYIFGLVWCGYGILMGTISYGTLVAIQQLIGQIQQPFSNLSGLLPNYYALLVSAERVMEIERIPKDLKEERMLTDQEIESLANTFSSVRMENITFAYDEKQEPVLENVTFCFDREDYVAIVGESGIGKSTMLKLLLSVYQNYDGTMKIIIDGVKEQLSITARYRKLFAYVPQGSYLMSGTIRDAVAFLRKPDESEVSFNRIKEACAIACADEFINELPEGYDTFLGENGAGLSEGQIQRISIARAIYSQAPILLLDEATSALDEHTEAKVLRNLKQLTNKTVVIVTHRKAVLDICNKVVALKDKKVVVRNESRD